MLPTSRNRGLVREGGRRRGFFPDMDYLMDEMLAPSGAWSAWAPPADLSETDDEFVLEMELPGFSRDDIELTVERNILSVSGSRQEPEVESASATYHLRERADERFSRSIALPRSVDAENVKARFSNGVLTVTLPKVDEAKPRRIEVEAS